MLRYSSNLCPSCCLQQKMISTRGKVKGWRYYERNYKGSLTTTGLSLLFLLLAKLTSFFSSRGFIQPTVFIPLNLTVYVVCSVRHMLRMCVLWCAVCIACYGCGAECVSHVRIICGWRYYFMTSSVKPLKHYGKKLGVNISSCSKILQ